MREKHVCVVLSIARNSSSSNASMSYSASREDIFQHRYYRLGKILMSLTGQWPYQRFHVRCGITVALLSFGTYQLIDQAMTVVKNRDDWDILVQCLTPYLFEAAAAVKYFSFICNSRKIIKLIHRIRMDWEVWARHKEVKTLHEYAERGEKIAIVYTGKSIMVKGSSTLINIGLSILCAAIVYFAIFNFMVQPMIVKLIDIVMNNGTEPGRFPCPVTYDHFDVQKYYFHINIYFTVCALIVGTVVVSGEVMLILCVQHVCGIFAAVGHKLERIRSNHTSAKTQGNLYALDKTDRAYLASCIDRHNDAIEYGKLIRSSYAWNLFFTLGIGMILAIVFVLQILLRSNDLGATVTFMGLTVGIIFVFYVECHISQICIDHSISIRFYIQNSQWYRLLPKNQKILQLMTMRCNAPCHLTVGNMLIMSVQTFGLTIRTFISYIAFVRSMQGV